MRTDALSVAETLVRDCLETLIQRYEVMLASAALRPRTRAESSAVVKLASSLLEHLDAEAKQMRADSDAARD